MSYRSIKKGYLSSMKLYPMYTNRIASFSLLVLILSSSCIPEITYDLRLKFQNRSDHDAVAQVRVWALEREATCLELTTGSRNPNQLGTYSTIEIDFPPESTNKLTSVPAQQVVFFAEAKDQSGQPFLRACTEVGVTGNSMMILLQMMHFCEPTAVDDIPNNQQDDDCDGLIDECDADDSDADSDGVPDCSDECPNDSDKTKEGICGCGKPDADEDKNDIIDCIDECAGAEDSDADGVCDPLDQCLGHDNAGDFDGDGQCNDVDTDDDADGWLDEDEAACSSDPWSSGSFPNDSDLDGICDPKDQCSGDDSSGDTDTDGECNDVDSDDDNDNWSDTEETACGSDPLLAASVPSDTDADHVCDLFDKCIGDDATVNTDGDEHCNDVDPDDDNDNWSDVEESACDSDPLLANSMPIDSDGDGVCNPQDQCTGDDASGNTDGDGQCNDIDTDDDADGWSDAEEIACGSNPLLPTSAPVDSDGDDICNPLDMCIGDDATGDTNANGICNDLIGKLWFVDSNVQIGYLDIEKEEITIIGSVPIFFTDIAFDSTGQLFGIDGNSLYKVDILGVQETELLDSIVQVGPQGTSWIAGMVGSNTGVLYAAGGGLWEIDPSTGMQTNIGNGSSDPYYCSGDLAFQDGILYMSSDMSNGFLINELVTINTENGDGTLIDYFYISDDYTHLRDHSFMAMGNHDAVTIAIMDNDLYRVDTETAILTHMFPIDAPRLGTIVGAAYEDEAQ